MTDWSAILREQEHRPYPLPAAPFAVTMTWHFARRLDVLAWPLERAETGGRTSR